MTNAQIIIIVTILLYLSCMLIIGAAFSRKSSSSSEEFYIGGRSLGPIVTAMSAEASDMSSWLLMGLPGLAYLAGIAEVGWTAIGLAIGTYLNWLIVAKRLRRYSARLDAFTVPDFFSRRYNDKKHLLSMAAALIIIIFFIPYTASGFKAVGTLFNSLFGVEYHIAMVFGSIVNTEGNRFFNEAGRWYEPYHRLLKQAEPVAWGIVDAENPEIQVLIDSTFVSFLEYSFFSPLELCLTGCFFPYLHV